MTKQIEKRPVGRPPLPANEKAKRATKTIRVPLELADLLKRVMSEYRAGNVDIEDIRALSNKSKGA